MSHCGISVSTNTSPDVQIIDDRRCGVPPARSVAAPRSRDISSWRRLAGSVANRDLAAGEDRVGSSEAPRRTEPKTSDLTDGLWPVARPGDPGMLTTFSYGMMMARFRLVSFIADLFVSVALCHVRRVLLWLS
jgi:hypothetical protein